MPIGQVERQTQQRVIQLFQETLGYRYLGHRRGRPDNRNVETELLEAFLKEQGHSAALIQRTLHLLNRAANDQTQGLCACNKAVHGPLRYSVPVKADAGEQTQTVFLIIFAAELQKAPPADFSPKGRFVVFVGECHRIQSGELHREQHDY